MRTTRATFSIVSDADFFELNWRVLVGSLQWCQVVDGVSCTVVDNGLLASSFIWETGLRHGVTSTCIRPCVLNDESVYTKGDRRASLFIFQDYIFFILSPLRYLTSFPFFLHVLHECELKASVSSVHLSAVSASPGAFPGLKETTRTRSC